MCSAFALAVYSLLLVVALSFLFGSAHGGSRCILRKGTAPCALCFYRRLDGRREPPPDPGRYDPATGGSDAQGAEPLPGETTAQYNERQASATATVFHQSRGRETEG